MPHQHYVEGWFASVIDVLTSVIHERYLPMILELPAFSDDDIHFVTNVDRVVRGISALHSPKQVQVHRVDNWFGDKWFKFSGKALGAIGVWDRRNVVVPPFVPNRITAQSSFTIVRSGVYRCTGPGQSLHQKKRSSDNLVNRVRQVIPDTALFWFTGNSKSNGRGAIMGYMPYRDKYWGWYLGYILDVDCACLRKLIFTTMTCCKLTKRVHSSKQVR